MNAEPTVVEVVGVTKKYHMGRVGVVALRGVTMTVAPGEFLAIVGPSGSGKTTLMNIMACIEAPTKGRVLLDGQDVTDRSSDELADLRSHRIGFIFQNFNLLPVLTALENIEYPLLTHRLSGRDRRRRAEAALEQVGLTRVARHKPLEMSGGQRQRVAIARAMVVEPSLVLADEPTANLDHGTGEEILKLMQSLNRAQGTTFVFSTHDARVMRLASRIVPLQDGLIAPAPESPA